MSKYKVNIHVFEDDDSLVSRVHLSNPDLYISQPDKDTTVDFKYPSNSSQTWSIDFGSSSLSPFSTTKDGSPVSPITQDMTPVYLCHDALVFKYDKDYNYKITIDGTDGYPAVSEDPQVIIGGRGSGGFGNWGRLNDASGAAVAAGIAGLLLGFLVYRAFGGKA